MEAEGRQYCFLFSSGHFALLCVGEFTAHIVHREASDDGVHSEQGFLKIFIFSELFIPGLYAAVVSTALQ